MTGVFSKESSREKALNVTTLVSIFVVVIFAVVTQLLAANGAISLSTTLQLTMWLVALGFIVLLAIAYMFFRVYETAEAAKAPNHHIGSYRPPTPVEHAIKHQADATAKERQRMVNVEAQLTGAEDAAEHKADIDEARAIVVQAEARLARAVTDKDAAEQKAKDARRKADAAEQDAKQAQGALTDAEDEAKQAQGALADAEEQLVTALTAEEVAAWRRAHRAA